jgi:uncharacterized protein
MNRLDAFRPLSRLDAAMAQILTVEDLRRVLPEPRPATLAKILPAIDQQGRRFIERSPFALMATSDAAGGLEVSPKGDAAGFAKLDDDRTLIIPERVGNNLAFGLQNILANGQIALIFMLPGTAETFRVSGRATLHDDADLLTRLSSKDRPALLAIRVSVERCYFHCARSITRAQLWRPEAWGERMRVSFGAIIAPRVGGDAAMAQDIDDRVETAITTRLWSNS